jgi:hypothetical protein
VVVLLSDFILLFHFHFPDFPISMKNLTTYLLLLAGLASITSCKKEIEPSPAAETITTTGNLSGANQVPAVNSSGAGTVTAVLNKDNNELNYTITYSGLTGPATAGHFHLGAPGTIGGIFITFTNLTSPITGKATLTAAQRDALLAGNVYANIHTAAFPAGEIRVNVTPPNIVVFSDPLTGANQVPAISSPGKGTAGGTFNKDTNVLTYTITYSDLTGPATLGHFHLGTPGTTGAPFITFKNLASPITGTETLTAAQRDEMLKGNMYANIHTAAFPAGEVRANVVAK